MYLYLYRAARRATRRITVARRPAQSPRGARPRAAQRTRPTRPHRATAARCRAATSRRAAALTLLTLPALLALLALIIRLRSLGRALVRTAAVTRVAAAAPRRRATRPRRPCRPRTAPGTAAATRPVEAEASYTCGAARGGWRCGRARCHRHLRCRRHPCRRCDLRLDLAHDCVGAFTHACVRLRGGCLELCGLCPEQLDLCRPAPSSRRRRLRRHGLAQCRQPQLRALERHRRFARRRAARRVLRGRATAAPTAAAATGGDRRLVKHHRRRRRRALVGRDGGRGPALVVSPRGAPRALLR